MIICTINFQWIKIYMAVQTDTIQYDDAPISEKLRYKCVKDLLFSSRYIHIHIDKYIHIHIYTHTCIYMYIL